MYYDYDNVTTKCMPHLGVSNEYNANVNVSSKTNPNTIKSYKNYLQNTQHMVLHNRPILSIGTERLACLNSPLACSWGPSPSTRQVLNRMNTF